MKNRELDRLIAEHIFGLEISTSEFMCRNGIVWVNIPHYSTDISDAWKVVEELQFPKVPFQISKAYKEYDFETYEWKTPGWEVVFDPYGERVWVDTPQLAICLCALKSAGVDLHEEN